MPFRRPGGAAPSFRHNKLMGWQHRRNGRQYYYRRVKQDGVWRTEYLGRGPKAMEAAAAAQRALAEEQARMHAEADWALLLAGPTDRSRQLRRWVRLLVEAAMLAAGYHRPSRHAWRKRYGA
jgi:hypothetical protein